MLRSARLGGVVRCQSGVHGWDRGSRLSVASPYRVEDARERAYGAAPRPGHKHGI